MSRDGNGNYTPPLLPVVGGQPIEADWANDTINDLSAALTDSLSRSGNGNMLAAFRATDGTITIPSIAFTNEPNSGLYRAGTGDYRLCVNGKDKARIRDVDGMPAFQVFDLAGTGAWETLATSADLSSLTLADVLAVGNTTGGTDIVVGDGDSVVFNAYIDDFCSIETNIVGPSTNLDFQLGDDDGDAFRFRFNHFGAAGGYLDALKIKPDVNVVARDKFIVNVTGTVAASEGLTADYIDLTGGESTTTTGTVACRMIVLNDASADQSDGSTIFTEANIPNSNDSSLIIQQSDNAADYIKLRLGSGGTGTLVDALTASVDGIDVTGTVTAESLAAGFLSSTSNLVLSADGGAATLGVNNTPNVSVNAAGNQIAISTGAAGVGVGKIVVSETSVAVYEDMDVTGTVTADLVKLNPTGGATEGGQIEFQRAVDNQTAWYVDVFGSATDTSLRFVDNDDANNPVNRVVMNNTGIDVTGTIDCDTSLQIQSSGSSVDAMPDLYMTNIETAADAQNLGMISFRGYNDASTPTIEGYANIYAQQVDVSDGAEKGKLVFQARDGAGYVEALEVNKDGIDVTGTVDLDNLTIATAQGTAGQVLKSTGSGIEWGSDSGGETLTQTLALGNATGGNDIVITDGDVITGTADPVIKPPAPSPGYGAPAIQLQTSGGFSRIVTTDLECKLFYGATAAVAAVKLATTNTGVTVTGGVIADEIAAPNSYFLTTSAVMTNSQNWNGKQVWNKHAGNTTLTLATDAQAPVGFSTTISVMSSGFTMTLTPDTGDTIKYLDPVANTWTGTVDQNLVIGSGGVIDLIRTATSEWTVYGSGVV